MKQPSFFATKAHACAKKIVPVFLILLMISAVMFSGCTSGEIEQTVPAPEVTEETFVYPQAEDTTEADTQPAEETNVTAASTEATIAETQVTEATEAQVTTAATEAEVTTTGETTAASTDSQEPMVWIPTHGGTKYHNDSSCSNMDGPEYVTKSTAINRGFTACKKCYD